MKIMAKKKKDEASAKGKRAMGKEKCSPRNS